MTTETFAGGHGAPSDQDLAFYSPDQKRNVLGEFAKEDGEGEETDWEKAKSMTVAQWDAMSDSQRAALLAAVYVADADKKPGASAALAKLRGWVAGGKDRKAAGKKAASGAKSAADKKKREAEAAKKKAEADKVRAERARNARRVRPDSVNSSHPDGYIIGESENKSTRMRWDKENSTYIVEKKDGGKWKESRRLKPAQAYDEFAKANSDWFRPAVQPYLEKKPTSTKPASKPASSKPGSSGGPVNEGTVTPPDRPVITKPEMVRPPKPGRRPAQVSKPKPTARRKRPLTAAAEVHTGAMIALIPREDLTASLAVDGGEEPEQLHMTEVYLGQSDDISDEEKFRIIDTLSAFAARQFEVDGDAFSVNLFNPPGTTSDDGKDRDACVTLGISGHDIAAFHDELMDTLERAGIEFPAQHEPRIPHITLVYTDDADLSYFTDRTGPITFDTLRVAFGGEVFDIPLGEGRDDDVMIASAANTEIFGLDDHGVPIVPNVLVDLKSFTKERDVNGPGPGHNLRNYWVKGEGAAKIGWKTPGDWTRCVRYVSKYVKDPKGLCSEYHHQATGMWPGDKRNPGMEDVTETFDTEMLYDEHRAAEGGDMTAAAAKTKRKKDEDEVDEVKTQEVDDAETPDEEPEETETPESQPDVEAAPTADEMERPASWDGVLTVEGIESGDGRMFGTNALTWDELPLPLRWQKEGAHGGQNDVTVSVGNIEKIWREPAPDGRAGVNFIRGSGTIDLGNPDGAEVYRRMKRGYMRGNSVDVDSVKGADVELVFPERTAEPKKDGEGGDDKLAIFDMSRTQPELTIYKKGRIRATTLVEIPAFTEARLALSSDETLVAPESNVEDDEDDSMVQAVNDQIEAIIAAATTIEISDAPPREWFDEPKDVQAAGALTVTKEGRIYGYVAPLGVRHRSFAGKEVTVPMRRVDYTRFMGGETIVADGGRVSTGAITMNCGHASTSPTLTASQAAEHYDNTCSMVATVRVGENRNGVWMAGALLPDVTPEQIRRIMASRLSGDWRAHLDKPGWREFVAALLVPVPGFPMARSAPSVQTSEGVLVASSVPVHFAVDDNDDTDIPEDKIEREDDEELDKEKRTTPKMRAQAAASRLTPARIAAMRERVSQHVPSPVDRATALRARVVTFTAETDVKG